MTAFGCPQEVIWGLTLLCLTLPINLIDYRRTAPIAENKNVHFASFFFAMSCVAVIVLLLAKRVGWLRYVLFAAVALSVRPVFGLHEIANRDVPMSPAGRVLLVGQTVMESVALILLFSTPADIWFAAD